MVDLHCHILPGLDDGPRTLEASLELARAASDAGIDTVVATPHIRDDHPFAIELIEERVGELRLALRDAEIDIEVVSGGEVALSKLVELDDETLAKLCMGEGRYLLVESPYTQAPSLLETALYDLQLRGFRPVLAHPERSSTFLSDRARLEDLAERDVLCSVTAMSLAGAFGKEISDFTLGLFRRGLVHNIASDAHDTTRRPPGFARALACLETELGGDTASVRWFTDDAGRAIIEGRSLRGGPPLLDGRRFGWRRMKKRVGLA